MSQTVANPSNPARQQRRRRTKKRQQVEQKRKRMTIPKPSKKEH